MSTSAPLVPCPLCQRHVYAIAASACPFCKANLPNDLARSAVPAATQRLNRAAMFAFATSLTVAACSSGGSTVGGGDDAGGDVGAAEDGGGDGGSTADTSVRKDAGPEDDGGPAALYGAPAEAGMTDSGGLQPIYGASPPEN